MSTAVFCAMRAFALVRSRLPLMRAYADAGWRVVALCEEDPTADELRAAGVALEPLPLFTDGRRPTALPALALALRRRLRDLRPDLLQVYNALPLMLAGATRAARAARVAVATVTGLGRGYDAGGWGRRLTLAGYGRGLADVAWTVFQNTDDAAILTARFPRLRGASSVILGSGADTERFRPTDGPPEAAPRVMMVSRLLWQKGVREFVALARTVRARRPDVRFQLVGEIVAVDPDGVPESWLRARADEGVLEFLGYRDDLEDLLPGAALLVHPTRYREGVPRVVLEAGACGVPVVASRGPGSDDVVRDGVTGVLVAPGDAAALAAAVGGLLEDDAGRAAMGRAAATHVREHASLELVTARYLALHRELGVEP